MNPKKSIAKQIETLFSHWPTQIDTDIFSFPGRPWEKVRVSLCASVANYKSPYESVAINITKTRKLETMKFFWLLFVLSSFRAFVMDLLWFSPSRRLYEPEAGLSELGTCSADLINSFLAPKMASLTYISYVENILLLIHVIFEEKSVMYLQTTTIHHVNFYMPNTVLRPTRRLFYASH